MMQWQRIEKAEFCYAVRVPEQWVERPPNLKNSPMETARFSDPADRRHTLIIFRGLPRPLTAAQFAERAQGSLESSGFTGFRISQARVAGRPGARLDCALLHDAGRIWAVREYFVTHGEVPFIIGCGSAAPDEDDELFTAVAEGFQILDQTPPTEDRRPGEAA